VQVVRNAGRFAGVVQDVAKKHTRALAREMPHFATDLHTSAYVTAYLSIRQLWSAAQKNKNKKNRGHSLV
jgi:hypothetical protein